MYRSAKITKVIENDTDSYFWLMCRTDPCDLTRLAVVGDIHRVTVVSQCNLLRTFTYRTTCTADMVRTVTGCMVQHVTT